MVNRSVGTRHRPIVIAIVLGVLLAGCGGAAANGTNTSSSTTSAPVSTSTTLAPVRAVGGKVTVLEVGDSLGIDLGWGMQWALGKDDKVDLVQDARGDTGLANTGFYNWPPELRSDIASSRPQIVVIFLGANDEQNFYVGSRYVSFGTPLWQQEYGSRVAEMMKEATSAGVRVLWVGMPIMRSPVLSAAMTKVDSVFKHETTGRAGVSYFSTWRLFSTPAGQFNGGTTDAAGTPSPLRDPDGVHLDTGGEDLLGAAVIKELRSLYKLP